MNALVQSANTPEALSRRFPNVLSANEKHELFIADKDLRNSVCFIADVGGENGALLFSEEHLRRGTPEFVAYERLLDRSGIAWEPIAVTVSVVASFYATTRTAAEASYGLLNSDMQKKVGGYIQTGAVRRASDVRFHIHGDFCNIRYKIDGRSIPVAQLRRHEGEAICRALYETMTSRMQGTNWNPREHQDAQLKPELANLLGIGGSRIQSSPVGEGSLMTLRLQAKPRGESFSLEQLGYMPEQLELIRRMIAKRRGLILFTGNTNQGKSTSMVAALEELLVSVNHQQDLVTVEDPIEYTFKSQAAYQIPVIEDDWPSAYRAILRHAPDHVMPGEVRDELSAQVVINMALAGASVWGTLHVFELMAIPERLIRLGVDRTTVFNHLLMTGMVQQSLVPTLCPHCKVPGIDGLPDHIRDLLHHAGVDITKVATRNRAGCGHHDCDEGAGGRAAACEICIPTAELMEVLDTKGMAHGRAHWIETDKGITKVDHLIWHIAAGRVCPLDADQIIPLVSERRSHLRRVA